MWKLVNEKGETFQIPCNKVVSVSRKVGDLVLAGDQSVSRDHAYLQVKTPAEDGVSLWDTKSKFGTFVNEGIADSSRIKSSEKISLNEGDRVRFGLQQNIWRLVREKLCVCTSNLSTAEKADLASILPQIGGRLQDKWMESCTHLTMKAISLTIKVVCALACGKPIVTPAFWQCYKDAICNSKAPPDISDFIPPLSEFLNRKKELFLPNASRKSFFKDRVFVFPSARHLQKYGCMVEYAGGKAIEVSSAVTLKELCKPNVIVVQHVGSESEVSSLYRKLVGELQSKKLRVIPEKDIGIAILDVSAEVFCNPSHNPHDFLRGMEKLHSDSDLGAVVAADTEEISVVSQSKLDNPETLETLAIPPTCSTKKSTQNEIEDSTVSYSGSSRKRSRDFFNKSQSTEDSSLDSASATADFSFFRNDSTKTDKRKDVLRHMETENDDLFSHKQEKPSSSKWSMDKTSDDFILPSPPKSIKRRKITKSFDNCDDADLFDFPSKPSSSHEMPENEEEDIFELDDSICNQRKKITQRKSESFSTSTNMFEDSDDIFVSDKPNLKRKAEFEDPDTMSLPILKHPKVSDSYLTSNNQNGFIGKKMLPQTKQELFINKTEDDDAELAEALRYHVVVETISLLVQPTRQTQNNLQTQGKNFKKFKKIWKAPPERKIISGTEDDHSDSAREEQEEDSHLSTLHDRNTVDEVEDEWTFRPMSQM